MKKLYQNNLRHPFRLRSVLLFLALVLLGSFVLPMNVSAAPLSSDELNKKAESTCGDAAIGTPDAACRHGFRAGYYGTDDRKETCIDRADYNKDEKNRCDYGYTQGSLTKAKEGNATNTCGEGSDAVKTKFDFGCQGKGNPIADIGFAIIRFLSFGVGLVVVVSIILAGIQYTTSEGNPEKTMAAKFRIRDALVALVVYIFIFAILQYLIPGGIFN